MRTWCVAAAGFLAAALTVGCGDTSTGEVSGTVSVDGQVPMDGASISFIPTDGKSPQAGATLEDGKYKVKVAAGPCKVQIRVPEPDEKKRGSAGGPGGGLWIKEALPVKYHEKTELTYEVKPGQQVKDWEVSKKK